MNLFTIIFNLLFQCTATASYGQITSKSALGRMGRTEQPLPPPVTVKWSLQQHLWQYHNRFNYWGAEYSSREWNSGNTLHTWRTYDSLSPQKWWLLLCCFCKNEQNENQCTGKLNIFTIQYFVQSEANSISRFSWCNLQTKIIFFAEAFSF